METEQVPSAFKVVKWTAVAEWGFDKLTSDQCGICKNKLTEQCHECIAEKRDRSECLVGWGQCCHTYHNHCINAWVIKKNKCPLCQKPWALVRTERI